MHDDQWDFCRECAEIMKTKVCVDIEDYDSMLMHSEQRQTLNRLIRTVERDDENATSIPIKDIRVIMDF